MIRRVLKALTVLGVSVAALVYWLQPERLPDDLIVTGGPIITMDPTSTQPEALRILQGRITGVGALSDLQTGSLPVIDLQGQTLIPGLIEPHTHPIATALLGAAVDISGFRHRSRAEVMQTLAEATGGLALTPWLVAYGWDPVAIADLTPPSLAELDALAPDRPMVIITQMLHEVYANSAAMAAAGLDGSDAPEVEGVMRDDLGRLTGAFRELEAVNLILDAIPPADPALVELLVRRQYAAYARAGYTSIGITGAVGKHADPVGLLQRIGRDGSPLRSYLYLLDGQQGALGGDDDFRILGTKIWMDGSPFTGGAAFRDPYEHSELTDERMHIPHGHIGPMNHSAADFAAQVARLQASGLQIAVHTQGERAIDRVLDAFAAAGPAPQLRHRLEHNALITEAQINRAVALGISLGFFVDHIYYYGDALPQIVGGRADRYMPLHSAQQAGAVLTLHGDHPASPLDPLRSLRVAVDRRSQSGQTTTAPDQALTRNQALAAMTINAARQLGQQAVIGSIELGKRADFTLMQGNPLLDNWEALAITGTWKDGQPVATGPANWLRVGPVLAALRGMLF